jgi:signal transduction histidine kinase
LADRKLMSTALAQLVDNRVKYSSRIRQIGIAVALINQEVTVTIESQGEPIRPPIANVSSIASIGPRGSNRPPGTGLGVYRQAVDAHRGRLGPRSGRRQVDILHRTAGYARRFMTSQGNILITDDEPDLRARFNRTLTRWVSKSPKRPTESKP